VGAFGYMDLMIIAKWLTDFTGRESQAPGVISMMIGMALNGGAVDEGTVAVLGSNSGVTRTEYILSPSGTYLCPMDACSQTNLFE